MLLKISEQVYKDHATYEDVRRKIHAVTEECNDLKIMVKKQKLKWFGHISRSSDLANTILQDRVTQEKEDVGR